MTQLNNNDNPQKDVNDIFGDMVFVQSEMTLVPDFDASPEKEKPTEDVSSTADVSSPLAILVDVDLSNSDTEKGVVEETKNNEDKGSDPTDEKSGAAETSEKITVHVTASKLLSRSHLLRTEGEQLALDVEQRRLKIREQKGKDLLKLEQKAINLRKQATRTMERAQSQIEKETEKYQRSLSKLSEQAQKASEKANDLRQRAVSRDSTAVGYQGDIQGYYGDILGYEGSISGYEGDIADYQAEIRAFQIEGGQALSKIPGKEGSIEGKRQSIQGKRTSIENKRQLIKKKQDAIAEKQYQARNFRAEASEKDQEAAKLREESARLSAVPVTPPESALEAQGEANLMLVEAALVEIQIEKNRKKEPDYSECDDQIKDSLEIFRLSAEMEADSEIVKQDETRALDVQKKWLERHISFEPRFFVFNTKTGDYYFEDESSRQASGGFFLGEAYGLPHNSGRFFGRFMTRGYLILSDCSYIIDCSAGMITCPVADTYLVRDSSDPKKLYMRAPDC